MQIALTQYPITRFERWDDWAAHSAQWAAEAAKQGANLLLFPEYGSMELTTLMTAQEQSDLQRQIQGMARLHSDFLSVFAHIARRHNIIVVAPTLPVREGERTCNRAYVFASNGDLAGHQDKLQMTRFERESWSIQPPERAELTLFETQWGNFGIQICYDVEFALGTAVLCRAGAELILAPSCTETAQGAARVHIGARARALENQCYVAVSQTVGDAPWSLAVDVNYGYAALYGPPDLGFPDDGILAQYPPQQSGLWTQKIDFQQIKITRKEAQVLNFQDHQFVDFFLNKRPLRVRKVFVA